MQQLNPVPVQYRRLPAQKAPDAVERACEVRAAWLFVVFYRPYMPERYAGSRYISRGKWYDD